MSLSLFLLHYNNSLSFNKSLFCKSPGIALCLFPLSFSVLVLLVCCVFSPDHPVVSCFLSLSLQSSLSVVLRPSQALVTFFLQVTVVLLLTQRVVVVVMDPLLLQGQPLDLKLGALGLLHGLELVGCGHGASERGGLRQLTERSAWTRSLLLTEQLLAEDLAVSEGVGQDGGAERGTGVGEARQRGPRCQRVYQGVNPARCCVLLMQVEVGVDV